MFLEFTARLFIIMLRSDGGGNAVFPARLFLALSAVNSDAILLVLWDHTPT